MFDTYKLNIPALVFLIGAVAIYLGAAGGTDFERGVAGLLTMTCADVVSYTLEGTRPWLKLAVQVLLPIGVAVYAWGLYLVLTGMS